MYLGDGTFFEPGEYELRAPPVGVSHKFIMFLRQSSEELNFPVALEEAKRFGFSVVEFTKAGLIQPESLAVSTKGGPIVADGGPQTIVYCHRLADSA
jgi:hypothetical protein